MDDLERILKKLEEKRDGLHDLTTFQGKAESDIHIIYRQLADVSDQLNRIWGMSEKLKEIDAERRITADRVSDLFKKVSQIENVVGAVENLRTIFDLRFDNFSKDFERMKIISEDSKSENISQHKDLTNIKSRLAHIEGKMDSLIDKSSITANQANNTEDRINRVMKIIAAIGIGVAIALGEILINFLKK